MKNEYNFVGEPYALIQLCFLLLIHVFHSQGDEVLTIILNILLAEIASVIRTINSGDTMFSSNSDYTLVFGGHHRI